jgi:hypothetical protein
MIAEQFLRSIHEVHNLLKGMGLLEIQGFDRGDWQFETTSLQYVLFIGENCQVEDHRCVFATIETYVGSRPTSYTILLIDIHERCD